MLCLDASPRAPDEIPLKTTMTNSLYHERTVTRYVSGVNGCFSSITSGFRILRVRANILQPVVSFFELAHELQCKVWDDTKHYRGDLVLCQILQICL